MTKTIRRYGTRDIALSILLGMELRTGKIKGDFNFEVALDEIVIDLNNYRKRILRKGLTKE